MYYKKHILAKPFQTMDSTQKFINPVIIKNYRGFTIRKYTKIQVRITVEDAKKVIDAKLDRDLSVKQVIEKKIILCPDCPTEQITPERKKHDKGY